MSDEIGQLEFRWTAARQGFFATAASPGAMRWEQRLQPVARPPAIKLPATVVYQTFDESAAIIFRHILPSVGGTATERETLAARVLIGPAELLTPEIALGCAALASPGFLRPAIGRVPDGGELPALAFGAIKGEAASWELQAGLDHAARRWASGGELAQVLLAATLTRPTMAATVHLDFQRTHGLDIAALLWGLWRLAFPILRSERDWSFSTGETSLGTRAQTRLPNLIIRDLGVESGPPAAPRPEIVLSQDERYAPGQYPARPLADRLVDAYVRVSVPGVPRELEFLDPAGTVEGRLDDVCRSLGLLRNPAPPAVPVSPAGPVQPVGPARPALNRWDQQGYPAQDRMWAGEGDDACQAGLGGQRSADAAPALAITLPAETFDSLLHELGCGNPDAVRHLEYLAARPHRPGRGQRRALLRQVADQGWYVRQLDGLRPSGAETCVGHLLVLLAEPDLADPEHYQEMRQELAGLMNGPGAGVALLALERLARARDDAGLWNLTAHLFGSRVLSDLGRYCPAEAPREPGSSRGVPRRSRWRWPFRGRGGGVRQSLSPVRVARISFGLFLAETVILCLVLVFR